MNKIDFLKNILDKNNVIYEIIKHDRPIFSTKDAEIYFDILKTVPIVILFTEKGLFAYIKSITSGKINFSIVKNIISCDDVEMADKKLIYDKTGFTIGSIPLIGLSLPCIFDKKLLEFDYVYGGTGDPNYTLKIAPTDIKKLNNIIATV